MDGSTVEAADCQLLQSPKLQADEHQHLKLNNNSPNDEASLLKVPKRKLSVFYRSFDVIETKNQESALEFRRTSSSPSVHLNELQDKEPKKKETHQETSPCKTGSVSYRSLVETSKFLSCSSPECLGQGSSSNPQRSPMKRSPVMPQKLPQVKEYIVDDHATVTEISTGKHLKLSDNGNNRSKNVDDKVAESAEGNHFQFPVEATPSFDTNPENGGREKNFRSGQNQQADAASDDLVKIKDPTCPQAIVDALGVGREKYMAVGAEMSSHEDSSIGSESEEDVIEANLGNEGSGRIEATRREVLLQLSAFFSIDEVPGKPDSTETTGEGKPEDLVQSIREKRQRFFVARRSLSESDCKQYHRARWHCSCNKQEESIRKQEQFQAFPSFTDGRLQSMGLTNFDETNDLYSENNVSSESELERKYIAFSIGLGTDRITLKRRVMISRRQRDLSEQNFEHEVQKLQEEIEDLSRYFLYTDGESMEKVERVRHRLDIVKTCAHRISSAAETLGAVLQEHRISPGIFIADKYVRILRSRCENLSTEIAEIKRILSMHNIVIEEDSGEIYDAPLQPTRYRNGSSLNNRTVMARRRASIATISRPLTSQDVVKDCSRQRNSVSGRVTIRRPSWYSEMRWENDKQNRKDSSSSVAELRDITEQTESRRNSYEENNNLLRHNQVDNIDIMNRDVFDNVKDEDRVSSVSTYSLESRIVERQLVSCILTAEPFRITRNFRTWRPILWYTLFFFLGFYINYLTLSVNTSVANIS